jgi:hypothetical protein
MARSTTYRNAATNAVGQALTSYVALHTSTGAGGAAANEVTGGTYARQQIVFPAAASGSAQAQVTFNVPAGTTVTGWSRQSAATGSAWIEDAQFGTSAVFNSAGTLTVTLTINTPA